MPTDWQEEGSSLHRIKYISFGQKQVPVITQNQNGPCPLIAIVNVLTLQGRLSLPHLESVTASQLLEFLGDFIFDSRNQPNDPNYEQNMMDALSFLPKLQTGLDVNVRFTRIDDFEFTPELVIFDLLSINLVHGWIVDPQDHETARAIGNLSYNQLVEQIINRKSSHDPEQQTQAILAEEFLAVTATQLTRHGLEELLRCVPDGELSILFRNNHFITLYKKDGALYQLVTDLGFLAEPEVAWETLSNIENDGVFVNDHLQPVPKMSQEDRDYQLALSLQEEGQREAEQWCKIKEELGAMGEISDEELARRLQAREEAQCAMQSQEKGLQEEQEPPASSSKASSTLPHPHSHPHPHPQPSLRGEKEGPTVQLRPSESSEPVSSHSRHRHSRHKANKPCCVL